MNHIYIDKVAYGATLKITKHMVTILQFILNSRGRQSTKTSLFQAADIVIWKAEDHTTKLSHVNIRTFTVRCNLVFKST